MVDSRGRIVSNSQKVQTFLSPSQIDEMLTRLADGETVTRLAAEYKVHRATVWRQMRKHGVLSVRGG
jgi:transcriptional regulator of acetoin/glycerol metabolism